MKSSGIYTPNAYKVICRIAGMSQVVTIGTNSTLSNFNAISYVGRLCMMSRIDSWHRKISTGRYFQNGHHNTAQIQHCLISTTFHMGRLWCPELIPDIEKFLPFAIFKMATTILHKFNIIRFQRPELIPDIEKFLPISIFKMATTIPQKFNIVRFQRYM